MAIQVTWVWTSAGEEVYFVELYATGKATESDVGAVPFSFLALCELVSFPSKKVWVEFELTRPMVLGVNCFLFAAANPTSVGIRILYVFLY